MENISNKVARSKQALSMSAKVFIKNIKYQAELYNPITNLFAIYKELCMPITDEGLQQLMFSRHIQYMKLLWNVNKVTELASLSL